MKKVLSGHPILRPSGVEYIFNYEFQAEQSFPLPRSAMERILSRAKLRGEFREM
jgi:hypothetical protein